MGLTLEKLQRLERAELVAFFDKHKADWQAVAQDAYDYTKKQFAGEPVRPDDIEKFVRPVVEINKGLRKHLDAKRLSQKYWIDFFTNLVVDRTWATITK